VPAGQPRPEAAEPAGSAPSLAEQFAAEPLEPTWAVDHEHEIDRRLGALPGAGIVLEPTECRSRQCRVSITADDDATLGHFIARFQETAGLRGYAHMIVLEAITTADSGRRRERVYVRFE
jgi:hypothetical protein